MVWYGMVGICVVFIKHLFIKQIYRDFKKLVCNYL